MARKGQVRKAKRQLMDTDTEFYTEEELKSTQKRKRWSLHDLHSIRALTEGQRELIESYIQGFNVIASGSPGTGKTYVGLWLALQYTFHRRKAKENHNRSFDCNYRS